MHLLPDFEEYNHHPRILTHGHAPRGRDLTVFDNIKKFYEWMTNKYTTTNGSIVRSYYMTINADSHTLNNYNVEFVYVMHDIGKRLEDKQSVWGKMQIEQMNVGISTIVNFPSSSVFIRISDDSPVFVSINQEHVIKTKGGGRRRWKKRRRRRRRVAQRYHQVHVKTSIDAANRHGFVRESLSR
jgi:hypothetical protein